MTLALTDGAEAASGNGLDLSHPTVNAVAEWTKGRTFYQMQQEFTATKGGKTYERENGKGEHKAMTPEEALEFQRTLCKTAAEHLAAVHAQQSYTALETDAELDGLINHAQAVKEAAEAWRQLTKEERTRLLAEQLAKLLPEPEAKKKARKGKSNEEAA